MVRTSAVQAIQKPNASVSGAADQKMLRRAKAKKAAIQRKVVVRKQERGRVGRPPTEKKAAARRRTTVKEVDTAVPTEKFSWKKRTARQVRKEKRKPISPGRSRKPLWILWGVEDVGCWSVVVTELMGIAGGDVLRCCSQAAGFGAAVSLLRGSANRRREEKRLQIFYKRETNVGQMEVLAGGVGVECGFAEDS
jgi:hypothetical protein